MELERERERERERGEREERERDIIRLCCKLPGKVICLPDLKIQEYPLLPGKLNFTVFSLGKKSKSKLILRQ